MKATLLTHGLYGLPADGVRRVQATTSEHDFVETDRLPHLLTTDTVTMKLGTTFGITYHVSHWGMDLDLPLRFCIFHPVLYPPWAPNGRTHVSHVFEAATDAEDFSFFTFDEPWEMVAGKWTFRVYFQDRLLLTRAFHVISPP